MANPFGGFVHTSPLSSLPHNPPVEVASNCVRDYFGPTVQTVADCLHSRGESTMPQILSAVRRQCRRVLNEERERLVDRLGPITGGRGRPRINKARGPEGAGFIDDAAPMRAALIVLIQHSLVTASPPPPKDEEEDVSGGRGGGNGESGGGGRGRGGAKNVQYRYRYHPDRARLLSRYPKYVEHAKRALDETAAIVVEEMCAHGRMRAEDCVRLGAEYILKKAADEGEDEEDDDDDEEEGDDGGGGDGKKKTAAEVEARAAEARSSIASALKKLIEGGFLQRVRPIEEPKGSEDNPDEREFEWSPDAAADLELGSGHKSTAGGDKKRKREEEEGGGKGGGGTKKEEGGEDDAVLDLVDTDDEEVPAVVPDPGEDEEREREKDHDRRDRDIDGPGVDPDNALILRSLRRVDPHRRLLPVGSVWRVNVDMFHDSVRALCLGRLVAERYGDKVQSAGSMITAALKLAARRMHSPVSWTARMSEDQKRRAMEERTVFTPEDIMEYLPDPVLNVLKGKAGGARANLSTALVSLCRFTWPVALMEVEEARGHPMGGKFEVATRQLVEHLRGRVLHRTVVDMHGEVPARICSILETKGHLDADAIAAAAMVPAKDVREVRLYIYRT